MRGKVLLLIGLGVGYYFGAKAGRSRYRQIRTVANKVWTSQPVQRTKEQAEDFVRGIAPEVVDKLVQGGRFVSDFIGASAEKSSQAKLEDNLKTRSTGAKTSTRKTVATRSSSTKKPAATKNKTSGTSKGSTAGA